MPDAFQTTTLASGFEFIPEAIKAASSSASTFLFAAPPYISFSLSSRSFPPDWRRAHGHLGIPEVFVQQLLAADEASLFEPGPNLDAVAVLLPGHTLTSQITRDWRSLHFPNHAALVIEHGGEAFGLMMPVSTVVFHRTPGPIKFFNLHHIPDDVSADDISADLARLVRQPAGTSRFGYVLDRPLEDEYPCTFDFYSAETERLREQSSLLGERVSLSEIAEVFRPPRPTMRGRGPGPNAVAGFDFINGRDITEDGRVILDELRHQDDAQEQVTFLQDGDFCIREMFKDRPDRGFIVGVFESDGREIAAGRSVIVVRPKPFLSPEQRQVLLCYLRSPIAGKLSSAKGLNARLAGAIRINVSGLRDFPVPIADEELTKSLSVIESARQAFLEWERDCQEAANALVAMEDAADSKRALVEAGRLAKLRFRAGEQVESLDFRVLRQFPHPLAYLWRQTVVGTTDPYRRFRDILKTAESYTCFMALLSIVMARCAGKKIASLGTLSKRLGKRSGTSWGDWFAVLQEVNTSRQFRDLDTSDSFFELTILFNQPGVEDALRALMALRNDDGHGRSSHTTISTSDADSAFHELEKIFAGAEFLTDLRLMLITETKFDALSKSTRYEYRDLAGDHPLAPLRSGRCDRSDLEADSLYLTDRSGKLHLLRPLLHYLECPKCHQLSTFFLDTYSGKGETVSLKSLERGSTREEVIAEHFRLVGLLPDNSQ